MSSYITQSELTKRFPKIDFKSDDDGDYVGDSDIVTQIIEDASAQIDAAAGVFYSVPLSLSDAATANIIRNVCATLSAYKVSMRRPPVDPDLRQSYQDCLDFLAALAKGNRVLPGENSGNDAPMSSLIMFGTGRRITSYDGLRGL